MQELTTFPISGDLTPPAESKEQVYLPLISWEGSHGRGAGVGRGLGVGLGLGVALRVGVDVTVGVAVGVTVGQVLL